MALFLLKTVDGKIEQVVRAACRACARRIAVENAREEGTAIWRDPEQSTVHDIDPIGPRNGVVLRKEIG